MDEHLDLLVAPLDLDLGNTGGIEGLLQELTDLLILDQQVTDLIVASIPARVPVFDDTHTETVGIDFLSHKLNLLAYSFSLTTTVM